jgi:hypothetical protein
MGEGEAPMTLGPPAVCLACRRSAVVKMVRFLEPKRRHSEAAGQVAEAEALEAAVSGVLSMRFTCSKCGQLHPVVTAPVEEAS